MKLISNAHFSKLTVRNINITEVGVYKDFVIIGDCMKFEIV